MKTVNIYTDGACSGNQHESNVGGWGCILEYEGHEKELCGGEIDTTNNRMELTALAAGLEALKHKSLKLHVFADSSYLINCLRERWYERWQLNGWRTSTKRPVENRDLWEKLIDLIDGHNVSYFFIKGHLDRNAANRKMDAEYKRFVKHNGTSFNYDEFLQIAAMNWRADELANVFINEHRAAEKEEGAENNEGKSDADPTENIKKG